MSLEEWKASRLAVWGPAPFERVSHQLDPVHEHPIAALRPQPGVRLPQAYVIVVGRRQ